MAPGVSGKAQVRASVQPPCSWAPCTAPVLVAGRDWPRDVHHPGGTSAGAGGTRWHNRAGDPESRLRVWRNKVSKAVSGSQGSREQGLWASRVGAGELSNTRG